DKLNLSPTDFRSETVVQSVGGMAQKLDAEDLF
ncbi:MAG: hypothetical protein RI953_2879, partial [Pseudomonadota bacterium]